MANTETASSHLCDTAAEAKAHRMNRQEQQRLSVAHSFLSRQERHVDKDFKTSVIKMEALHRRRLSSYDGGAGLPGVAAAANPCSAPDSAPCRRASETPRASSRSSLHRLSAWDLPDHLAHGGLHRRRQTYGGMSTGFLSRPGSGAGAQPTAPDRRYSKRLSQMVHPRPAFSDEHLPVLDGREGSHVKVPTITVDDPDKDAAADSGLEKTSGISLRPKAASAHALKQRSVKAVPLDRLLIKGPRAATTKAHKSNVQDRRRSLGRDKEKCSPGGAPRPVGRPLGKPARLDSHSAPTTRCLSVIPHAGDISPGLLHPLKYCPEAPCPDIPESIPELETDSLRGNASALFNTSRKSSMALSDCSRKNSSVHFDCSRKNSVIFVGLPKSSESVGHVGLQQRVVRFLEQQAEFNKRFPLTDHIVTSLECVRPDLLQARRKPKLTVSKKKAKIIAEVLQLLGLDIPVGGMDSTTAGVK